MHPGSRNSLIFFSVFVLLVIIFTLCSGCIYPGLVADKIFPQKTKEDPITGSWNGFIATAGGKEITGDPALAEEVAKTRLNIYPDRTFEYTTNFSIRNGTLVPTGKGNYMVKANETDKERKYFHYDETLDSLKWESQDMTIEFRRNDHLLSSADLSDYNAKMMEEFEQVHQTDSETQPTPVPTMAVAEIHSEGFGYDTTSETAYQVNGDVLVENGTYESVSVIVRYPDLDSYKIDVGGMGGRNFTRKEFKIVLNDRVRNETPAFFIKLGTVEYPTIPNGQVSDYTLYTAYTNST